MNRDELAEVLRAASAITDDRPLVMGSQAILGSYDEDALPPAATVSMEADVAFLDDDDRHKADMVTGAIGEDSNFHQLRGFYAEGIHVETATLPDGWRDRLITWSVPPGANGPGTVASFLDPHDLVVAKLAAFREKDVRFVTALTRAGLVDPLVALERLEHTELHPVARQRAAGLLVGLDTPTTAAPEEGADRLRRSVEIEKRTPPRPGPDRGRDRGPDR
ncbi:DUF6036 family nucleotidyltransferase [Nocardioides currus]|uniref:DUF6036 family nucleotidyltransferase n=1 Tax=Nocardioides currus TaxID=2133958 RepID=UPI001A9C28A1|nr:DUF6036 family nucleotidyltransferase [Nocardioides currus]